MPSNLAPIGPLGLFTHQILGPLKKRFLRKYIDVSNLVLYEKEATGQADTYTCTISQITKYLVENKLAQVKTKESAKIHQTVGKGLIFLVFLRKIVFSN